MSYADFVSGVESPTGEDNRMGSGAFSKYQFMPQTAAGLAQRTAWGRGLTPANIKAAVMADPSRAEELFKLYNADSSGALKSAGLPANNTSMLALHRFGQGGGTSLLQAPGSMPVANWVRSVNWGAGVSPDAVIKQNGLDRYANVGDLRRGFLGGTEPSQAAPVADVFDAPPAPPTAQPALFAESDPQLGLAAATGELANAFTQPEAPKRPRQQVRVNPLFDGRY